MYTISQKEFEAMVACGVQEIPPKFRTRIKNAVFLTVDEPTAAQRKEQGLEADETLLGLYEGIPHPARGVEYGNLAMPDKITIFKKPIEIEATFLVEEYFSNSVRSYTIA